MVWIDPAMPWLEQALDLGAMRILAQQHLPGVDILAARLVRHKPGRRCLIEYAVTTPDGPDVLLGKVRAKGLDVASYETQRACLLAGLPVAEPVGVIPELRMWLQRRLPGDSVTEAIGGEDGVRLAQQVAELAHALHRAGVPARKQHTLADELRILEERLTALAVERPRLATRLGAVLTACCRMESALPARQPCGIHRDFYADQVLAGGERLYLLDLDLYCLGEPCLDIGNFVGHLTEQSLRQHGVPDGSRKQEQAIAERYAELYGSDVLPDIRAYATLTLARHIQLSTRFPERQHLTEYLLELVEERLGLKAAVA